MYDLHQRNGQKAISVLAYLHRKNSWLIRREFRLLVRMVK